MSVYAYVPWRKCRDCEVSWRGHEEECWSCGLPGKRGLEPSPPTDGMTTLHPIETVEKLQGFRARP